MIFYRRSEIKEYTKPLEKSESLGVLFSANVAYDCFTSCFDYLANNQMRLQECLQEIEKVEKSARTCYSVYADVNKVCT